MLAPAVYGALTGSKGGPWGAVAGVAVGISFGVMETGYDVIAKPMYNQVITGLSSWENTLRSGRIR